MPSLRDVLAVIGAGTVAAHVAVVILMLRAERVRRREHAIAQMTARVREIQDDDIDIWAGCG